MKPAPSRRRILPRLTRSGAGSVFPPMLAYLLGGSALAFAALLIPTKFEMFRRFVSDGDLGRGMQIATARTGFFHKDDPAIGAADSSTAESLRYTIAAARARQWNQESMHCVLAVLENAQDVSRCAGILRREGRDLPREKRETVLDALGMRALSLGRPLEAAAVYRHLDDSFSPGLPTVRNMVAAFRASSWHEDAGRAIDSFREKNGGSLPPDLIEARVAVALADGKPGEAFDFMKREFTGAEDRAAMKRILEVITSTATQSGRSLELIPLYEKYLRQDLAARADWQSFLELAGRNESSLTADFSLVGFSLARCYEWTGRPDEAFDLYMKLSVLGKREAFDRCLDLHVSLHRYADLTRVLLATEEMLGDGAITRQLANLLARSARYEEAEIYFEKYLRQFPEDADAWSELAQNQDEAAWLGRALASYRRASVLRPEDAALKHKIARLLTSLGYFDEALELYSEFIDDSEDVLIWESYLNLANSLGKNEVSAHALQGLIRLKNDPAAPVYQELASLYYELQDLENRIAVLERGLRRYPRNQELRIDLAWAYQSAGDLESATALLRTPSMKENPEALAALIRLEDMGRQFDRALRFLGAGIEDRVYLPSESLLALANMYLESGDTGRAENILRSLSGQEALYGLAGLCLQTGDLQTARHYAEEYLEQNPKAGHAAWTLLGDILRESGQAPEAQHAYAKALSLFGRPGDAEDAAR